MIPLYPLKFFPIMKAKIWGGEKLKSVLQKPTDQKNIGESWEVSDVQGDTSVVANGSLEGKTLTELMQSYGAELLGKRVFDQFGTKFPLLIKFIDAKEALSIQLHPDDSVAKARHNSFGKTEMWYVVEVDQGANLIVGFKATTDAATYVKHVEDKSILELLNVEAVHPGQVFFIPTGRIHAIGAGVLLAEIQQTSDITYRIYDWERKDAQGKERELHTELALDAIDFTAESRYDTPYLKVSNTASEVINCPYFTTNILSLNRVVEIDHSQTDSFVIYLCVKGAVTIHYGNGLKEVLKKGETVLMPASIKTFNFAPDDEAELLEVFIPAKVIQK